MAETSGEPIVTAVPQPYTDPNASSPVIDIATATASPTTSKQPSPGGAAAQRPKNERRSSRLTMFRRSAPSQPRPELERAPNSTKKMLVRLSQRAQLNLKAWYNKGPRRKNETEILHDLEKSRLLFCELAMGTPMILAYASTMLPNQGERRVPVLFEQISVRVVKPNIEGLPRHTVKIIIEYGSGPSMMKWSVLRGQRDFLLLHGHLVKQKVWHRNSPKPPHMPRYRYYRSQEEAGAENDVISLSSGESAESAVSVRPPTYEAAVQHYLERLLKMYRFRADSNRLLSFLELSNMSIKLAPEYTFHGKEGNVIVRSRASQQGWRVRHWQPQDVAPMIHRHTNKWMLVRDSYIVLVENINSTNVLDVFMVDSKFEIHHHLKHSTTGDHESEHSTSRDRHSPLAVNGLSTPADAEHMRASGFFLQLRNGSRILKVATRGERDLARWQASITKMLDQTPWSKPNRFGSFAPVRKNVFGQWFVDGRDYFWALSVALESARDTIFILDWWLSPELYLRRPPEGNQEWRLDRVLRRRADAGVKIFVVVYRNVGATIPIDSQWTKHSLLDLHPNVHILRSPNQLNQKNAVFWAHHEKLCVIDNTLAFNGGIDLCFGRWDTPQHVLVDDSPQAFYANNAQALEQPFPTQTWPGKDYSNPRVKDFFELDKPYDDMYDRQTVPRMPWHDIHQMVVGQPARDLARHFVQRWNYVIRQKLPSRETPLLLPPADFTREELERLELTGTCEYQVLRSSSNWSLGLKDHEQSIQNAYLKLIDTSEHFVYIENQFFISSTVVDGVEIENQIGTALVQRILRAHARNEKWRAVIVIPLMPGFEAEVDSAEASSVRVICQCQFNTISRGTHSIFYRLERAGIHPENYISFLSLRKWGKIGPEKRLTTEQLYIHAKTMIVDDRAVIIGSANINERSMRGIRDSEVAVCVRDTQVVDSQMAGKPWKAAKFAHSLRLRLMREHMGIDVDKLDIIEQHAERLEEAAASAAEAKVRNQQDLDPSGIAEEPLGAEDKFQYWLYPELHSFNWHAGTDINRGLRDHKKLSLDRRVQGNSTHHADVNGDGYDQMRERKTLPSEWKTKIKAPHDPDDEAEAERIVETIFKEHFPADVDAFKRLFYQIWTNKPKPKLNGANTPNGAPSVPVVDDDGRVSGNESLQIDPWSFGDPLNESFLLDSVLAAAERNTAIFRQVFRCQPDNEVLSWKDYKKYTAHYNAFMAKQAEEGGPEGHDREKPERVDNHVLTGTVKRTNPEQYRNGSTKNNGKSGGSNNDQPNGVATAQLNGDSNGAEYAKDKRDHGDDDGADDNNGERSNVQEAFQDAFENPDDDEKLERWKAKYGEHATSSTAAGVPGIPSLSHILGQERPFKTAEISNESDVQSSETGTGAKTKTEVKTSPSHYQGLREDGSDAGANEPHYRHIDLARAAEIDEQLAGGEMKSGGPQGLGLRGFEGPAGSEVRFAESSNGQPESSQGSVSANDSKRLVSMRRWKHFDQVFSAQTAEEMLNAVTGHFVVFPTEWLSKELDAGNWNFQMDRMTPLEIYD